MRDLYDHITSNLDRFSPWYLTNTEFNLSLHQVHQTEIELNGPIGGAKKIPELIVSYKDKHLFDSIVGNIDAIQSRRHAKTAALITNKEMREMAFRYIRLPEPKAKSE